LKSLRLSKTVQAAILIVLVLFTYQPSLHNGFVWDDDDYVTNNPALATVDGLGKIWFSRDTTPQYYPITFTSFWIEYHLFGLNPVVFHATNILLHAANAMLVWMLLVYLGLPWAWLAAVLFAIHPVNVESVAWISERKNLLSGLFALCSLILCVKIFLSRQSEPDAQGNSHIDENSRHNVLYVISFILFVLALLSKSVVCMLPVVFLVLLWWKNRMSLKNFAATIPFFIAGIAAGINTMLLEKNLVGAHGPQWDLSLPERIIVAGRALWFYLYKLLCPANLVFIYPKWEIAASDWRQYLFPISALLVLLLLWAARNRIGKGAFTAAAVFSLTLLPALGFINYYPMQFSFVADHFQYLACISILAATVWGGYRLVCDKNKRLRAAVTVICALLVISLSLKARQEQNKYKDKKALWEDTIAKNPSCWMAYNNLGCLFYIRHGADAIDTAEKYISKALKLNPDYEYAIFNMAWLSYLKKRYSDAIAKYQYLLEKYPKAPPHLLARIHFGLGSVYTKLKQFGKAQKQFNLALEARPWFPECYNSMGVMFNDKGEKKKAIDAFLNALELNPDYPYARLNLAKLLFETGRLDRALVHYNYLKYNKTLPPEILANVYNDLGVILMRSNKDKEAGQALLKAIKLEPDFAKAYTNLGILMAKEGKKDHAIQHFTKALKIDPGHLEVRYRLAAALADKGEYEKAISQYNYILSHSKEADLKLLASVHNDMGIIYANHDKTEQAKKHFKKALALNPRFAEALNNLGLLMVSSGRPKEAIKYFTKALEVKPDYLSAANSLVALYCRMKEYDKALSELKALLSHRPDSSASISYNIACIYAITGDLESSARWLEKVIDMGMDIGRLIETDKDLANIRGSKYYDMLVAKMAKK